MKLDKNNTEINHMTVRHKGVKHHIYCSCYVIKYDSGDTPFNVSFINFNSVEDALKHGWSFKDKKTLICPDCTSAMVKRWWKRRTKTLPGG